MPFELPPLPYDYGALEPHIDAKTMEIHHDKHHQAYVNNVNKALDGTELQGKLDRGRPDRPRRAAGGDPHGRAQQRRRPRQPLAVLADHEPERRRRARRRARPRRSARRSAASTSFKEAVNDGGATRFGSGWAWLVVGRRQARRELDAQPGQPDHGRRRRRSSASTSGSTPTTSSTRTAGPTTSPPGGTWSTGTRSPGASTRRAQCVAALTTSVAVAVLRPPAASCRRSRSGFLPRPGPGARYHRQRRSRWKRRPATLTCAGTVTPGGLRRLSLVAVRPSRGGQRSARTRGRRQPDGYGRARPPAVRIAGHRADRSRPGGDGGHAERRAPAEPACAGEPLQLLPPQPGAASSYALPSRVQAGVAGTPLPRSRLEIGQVGGRPAAVKIPETAALSSKPWFNPRPDPGAVRPGEEPAGKRDPVVARAEQCPASPAPAVRRVVDLCPRACRGPRRRRASV